MSKVAETEGLTLQADTEGLTAGLRQRRIELLDFTVGVCSAGHQRAAREYEESLMRGTQEEIRAAAARKATAKHKLDRACDVLLSSLS